MGIILGLPLHITVSSSVNRKVQSVQEINAILGIENLGVIPNHEEKQYEEPSNVSSISGVKWEVNTIRLISNERRIQPLR